MSGYGASEGYGTATAQQSSEYTPLSAINPYTNSWVLKVRVTRKPDELRTWEANAAGRKAGKAGTIDVRDGQGGEIQISMFNAEADKFWGLFEKNKVYTISGGQIKTAKKQYTTIDNDYTIVLGRDSQVKYVEDDGSIGLISYRFTDIGRLNELKVIRPQDGQGAVKNTYCDIIGVAHEVGKLEEITSKAGATFTKRMVKLVDETGQVDCTLWNEEAKKFGEACAGKVFALKSCKVSSFNNRSLSGRQDAVAMDPKEVRADELRQWYAEKKEDITEEWPPAMSRAGPQGSYEPPMCLADSFSKGTQLKQDPQTGRFEGEWFQTIAYPVVISKKRAYYNSAGQGGNWKKVEQNGSTWTDANGNQYSKPEPRFIPRFAVADHTGQAWFSCFHDQAMQMFNAGRPAGATLRPEDIAKYDEGAPQEDSKKYEELFKGPNFRPWLFNCLAKMEEYDGVARRKVVCTRLLKPRWSDYSKHLIERINRA